MVKRGWSTCWSTSSQRSLACDYLIETPPSAAKHGGRFAISHVQQLPLESLLLAIAADVVGLGNAETAGQDGNDGVPHRDTELSRLSGDQLVKSLRDPHGALLARTAGLRGGAKT